MLSSMGDQMSAHKSGQLLGRSYGRDIYKHRRSNGGSHDGSNANSYYFHQNKSAAKNGESINTSSVSSGSGNSGRGFQQNSSSYDSQQFNKQPPQSYYRQQNFVGTDASPGGDEIESLRPLPSDFADHLEVRQHQLTGAMRAPPMMMDCELDVDGADLIDGDAIDDEDNNNISSFSVRQHQSLQHLRQLDCADSAEMDVYREHHRHNMSLLDQNQMDAISTDRYSQVTLQQRFASSDTREDYTNRRLPWAGQQQQRHVVPITRPDDQLDQTFARYKSPEIAHANEADRATFYGKTNLNSAQDRQAASIYNQPNLSHHHHQYHTFSYQQPTFKVKANEFSNYSLACPPSEIKSQQLQLQNRERKIATVEKSSQSSGSGASGPLIKVTKVKGRGKKMQGSKQHLATSEPYRHHRSSPGGSRKPVGPIGARNYVPNRANMAIRKPNLGCCGKLAKFSLFITNVLFWSAGIALGAWGILSLVEDHKYNLSQLFVFEPNSRMSLFQLLSWSYITLGCATALVGLCGCSAIFKNNRWILGLYIFLILAIFALDLATGLLAIIFQERLVANVRLRLGNKLRSEYGVQASFTAAIDYIQTKYECCGLEGHFDYDQSLWRLQRLGGFEATVARTCCHLRNTLDDQSHINPRPVNESMCQSTDVRFHQSYRYRKGCLDDLERLVRQKIWNFALGCGAVGAVILISLFFATCFCRSIPTNNSRKNSDSSQGQQQLKAVEKAQVVAQPGQTKSHMISAQTRPYR